MAYRTNMRAPFRPFGIGLDHEVFALCVDHHSAHTDGPESDGGEEDGQRWQNGVSENVEDVADAPLGQVSGAVRAEEGQQIETDCKYEH